MIKAPDARADRQRISIRTWIAAGITVPTLVISQASALQVRCAVSCTFCAE
jgi:hypothetical protein